MIREKIIEDLRGLLDSNNVDSFTDDEKESLKIVIDLLSQAPLDALFCRPNCIDCIHKAVCFRLDMRVDHTYAQKCGDFQTELLIIDLLLNRLFLLRKGVIL